MEEMYLWQMFIALLLGIVTGYIGKKIGFNFWGSWLFSWMFFHSCLTFLL